MTQKREIDYIKRRQRLGMAKDNISILENAITYLKKG